MFMIDCKSSEGNTIGFAAIRQYDRMLEYMSIPGVFVGIVWWSVSNDKVIWIPVKTLKQIKDEGKKSYNIKMLDDPNYESYEIPSKKLRTFMQSDYSQLAGGYYKCEQ